MTIKPSAPFIYWLVGCLLLTLLLYGGFVSLGISTTLSAGTWGFLAGWMLLFTLWDVGRGYALAYGLGWIFRQKQAATLNQRRLALAGVGALACVLQYVVVAYAVVLLSQADVKKTLVALALYFSYHGIAYLFFSKEWQRLCSH